MEKEGESHISDSFQVYGQENFESLSRLRIHKDTLALEFLEREIDWKDILAIDSKNEDKLLTPVVLTLFIKRKRWLRKIRRCVEKITFYVIPAHVAQLLLKVRRFMTHSDIDRPKFLIFHNPISGKDSTTQLQKGIRFIEKTHFEFEVVTTMYKNHCKEYLREKRPTSKDYWGVAIFSGDGLMYEFVNSQCEIPVVHAPAGSANGFSKTQALVAGEDCGVQENLFIAMKGLTTNANVVQLEFEKETQKIYSCLNIEWGFLADVDINSESLRWLGVLRFDVYALWKMLSPDVFYGKFTYSNSTTQLPPINEKITNPNFQTFEGGIYHFLMSMGPWGSVKHQFAPLLDPKSQTFDVQIIPFASGRSHLFKYFWNVDSGGHFDRENRCPKYNFNHYMPQSFRLQPQGEMRGYICVDGEAFEEQKVQGRIMVSKLSMFTLH